VETKDTRRPTSLWKRLNEAQRRSAAEAFWRDDSAAIEQAEAVSVIARRFNFRPKSVTALPLDRRARVLASTMPLPEGLASRLLVAYHLATQRPMMGTFLDTLGVAHEDGLIAEGTTPTVEKERLAEAVAAIRRAFPPQDVSLYLFTLMAQDPDAWGGLSQFTDEPSPIDRPTAR
jgi:hypothetical protein